MTYPPTLAPQGPVRADDGKTVGLHHVRHLTTFTQARVSSLEPREVILLSRCERVTPHHQRLKLDGSASLEEREDAGQGS
jgi:hypothetical protein